MSGAGKSFFAGARDTKNIADIAKDFEDFKKNAPSTWKDGSVKPKITKTIRKPANAGKPSTGESMGKRIARMVSRDQIFEEPCSRLTFDHDVQKGKIAEIWWDLPEWQRKEAERDVERCMGQPWFHALHPDIQAALSDHNEALFTKYKGSGVRFSSEFGQYFVHAGGAITLLRGAGMDDGVALEGCPCGNKHYKRV